MTPTISTNFPEFQRTLNHLAGQSSRTYPEIVNGQGLALASRAIRHTIKANADEIAVKLGQIATERKVSRKGKVSFKRIYRTDLNSLAHSIVNARRTKQGLPKIFGDDLDKAATRMIAARLRAVSFVRSGWIYAIRTLSKAVGYRDRREKLGRGETARMSGTPKGYAKQAHFALNSVVTCEIGNTALIQHDGKNPYHVAEEGLNLAMTETIADMKRHMQEKLQGVFNKFQPK